jgi:hypothetical protein
MTKLRIFGLIAVLVVAASIAAASAQTQILRGHHDKGPADVELTYTKWIAPSFPNLVGVVGGDIVGKFGGGGLRRTVNGSLVHLDAIYIVIAPDPAKSFTAHVKGTEDLNTLKAVLDLETERRRYASAAKSQRWGRFPVALAIGAVLFGIAAVVQASIPDQNGVIHACYVKSGGSLRVIDSAASCKSTETSLDWNQKGATGLRGPTGPKGSTGPKGTTGASG